jgi:hypothetical protein
MAGLRKRAWGKTRALFYGPPRGLGGKAGRTVDGSGFLTFTFSRGILQILLFISYQTGCFADGSCFFPPVVMKTQF